MDSLTISTDNYDYCSEARAMYAFRIERVSFFLVYRSRSKYDSSRRSAFLQWSVDEMVAGSSVTVDKPRPRVRYVYITDVYSIA